MTRSSDHPTSNTDPLADLLPASAAIESQARLALAEDIGSGDLTARLVRDDQRSLARIAAREAGVLCGSAWLEMTFRLLDPSIRVSWNMRDGQRFSDGDELCRLEGHARALLSGERTALNYLQVLSGTATRTRRYVDAVRGLPVRILDTRKTLPGLRAQQKYAVRCGGGYNHRQGLHDAILIKENHILASGSIATALATANRIAPAGTPIEIEVETLDELEQAIVGGAQQILLDNFSPERLRQAVALCAGRARLEASGGITLATVRAIAATGVDDISVGDLTKDVSAIDLSMRHLIGG